MNAHDSYATFNIGGKQRNCIMLLYSTRDYDGGSYWSYFTSGLLEIDPLTCRPLTGSDGKAIIYKIEEASDFYEKMGRNTSYCIDPEEVLAENFSFLLTKDVDSMPSPQLLRNIEQACRAE